MPINANVVFPHPYSSFSYICGAKSGNAKPAKLLKTVTEAMALAAKSGLNTQEVYDAVQASDGWSWINGNRIPHMLEGDQTIYSAIPNSQKDSVSISCP